MLVSLPVIVAFLILAVGSITDFRTREVPDYVSYFGVAFGLMYYTMHSILLMDYMPIALSLAGFAATLGLSTALYKLGQWGGGDSKALMAMGTLLLFPISLYDDFVSFALNLLVVGGVYGLVWMIALAIKNWSKVRKMYERVEQEKNMKMGKIASMITAATLLITSYYFWDSPYRFPLTLFGMMSIGTYYLLVMLRAVERVAFVNRVPVSMLTEGDWIVEDVKVKGKLLCGPKDLGVSNAQIALLKKNKVSSVVVKSGIPFIPAFLIALGVTVIMGNALFALV